MLADDELSRAVVAGHPAGVDIVSSRENNSGILHGQKVEAVILVLVAGRHGHYVLAC